MANSYDLQLEVAAPLAMFTRPDTGGTPVSYPVPTFSAAKGMFEAIAFFSNGRAWIRPTRVEVCRPRGGVGGRVEFQGYTTNYGGPNRKANLLQKGSIPGGASMQLHATVLRNVRYRLHGSIHGERSGDNNARHHLKDLFDRRLKRGQTFRTPCLGWSEFTCSYWGPFRESVTEIDVDLNLSIPSFLLAPWTTQSDGAYDASFIQDVHVKQGVLEFPMPRGWSI